MRSSKLILLFILIYFLTHLHFTFNPMKNILYAKDDWGDSSIDEGKKVKAKKEIKKSSKPKKQEVQEEDLSETAKDAEMEEDDLGEDEEETPKKKEKEQVKKEDKKDEVDEEEEDDLSEDDEEGDDQADEDDEETDDEGDEEDAQDKTPVKEEPKEAKPMVEITPDETNSESEGGIYEGLTPSEILTIKQGYKGKSYEETLTNQEWESIIGSTEDVYVIERGDTLWAVCSRLLDNPYYWPKLWQLNKYIGNPHFINPKEELHFFGGSDIEPPTLEVVKKGEPIPQAPQASEAKEGVQGEVGADEELPGVENIISNITKESKAEEGPPPNLPDLNASDFKYKANVEVIKAEAMAYKINYRMTGIISDDGLKEVGRILDAKTERVYLEVLDSVQLEFEREVSVGDKFMIFREDEFIENPDNGDNFGYLYKILGEVIVVSTKEDTIRGTIISSFGPIKRGDVLTVGIPYIYDIKTKLSNQKKEGNILCFDDSFYNYGSSYQVAYLSLGADDGIMEGNLFKIVRQEMLNNESYVSESDMFEEIIGSLIVLNVQKNNSAALLLRSKRPIVPGDKIVMINSRDELSPKNNVNLLRKNKNKNQNPAKKTTNKKKQEEEFEEE